MKNILVLGGNGYLGSKIINNVLCADNVYCTIRKGEGPNLLNIRKNVSIISDDLNEIKKVIETGNVDVLINTVCCYEREGTPLSSIISANLFFPLSVISYAIENGVGKIITIDTSLPKNVNLYSLTKKTVSEIGEYYAKKNASLVFYNVLLENFYGKDEPQNRFLHVVIDKLKKNEDIALTTGTQKRDFIYIEDVLSAFVVLLKHDDRGFQNVPLGTGEGPTIREVVSYLRDLIKSDSYLNFGAIPSRDNEPDCIANIEYLAKFGFSIKYPYKLGMKEII